MATAVAENGNEKMTHPLILWSMVLIQWINLTFSSLNYINLIFTIITAAIAFAYTMWYQIMRKS